MLELAFEQDKRVGGDVGVKQGAMPVVAVARIERQPVAHRGQRLGRARKELGVEDLRANVALVRKGAVAPPDRLGARELVIEKIAFVLVGVRDDWRIADEFLDLGQDGREARRILEIGGLDLVDLNRPRVDGRVGLTRSRQIAPLRQPSPPRSISRKPTSMTRPGGFQANGCLRTNSALGVCLPVVSASKATSLS